MFTTIHAVALRTVKHNERSSILTAWSAELGRLSLLMPAGNGAESRRRRALTMSLGLFEGVVDVRPGREIVPVKDVRPWSPVGRPVDLSANPATATVAMFLAEVLGVVTREGSVDNALWALVTHTVATLGTARGVTLANLPPAFLVRLASVSGIEPDFSEYQSGRGFDTLEGVFRTTRPNHDHWIDSDRTRLVNVFVRAAADYRHPGLLRLDRPTRAALLDGLINYFTLHNYPLNRLKSLEVLRSL